MTETTTTPFSEGDYKTLKQLRDAAYFKLLKSYGIFLAAIAYAANKGMTMHPSKRKMSAQQLSIAIWAFVLFFSALVIWFIVRDYRRNIMPINSDVKNGQKTCTSFHANKYVDFIYGNYLLFHPEKKDVYLAVSKDEFEEILNGDQLYVEQAVFSGEVLLLKQGDKKYEEAEEFSFLNHPKNKNTP